MPKTINEKKYSMDRLYKAVYGEETIYLYAPTDASAQQKALEYLKPRKRMMSLFHVTRA
jgi:hypothetical protein